MKVAPIKPIVASDALDKTDVRVGTIELVEDGQKSDKFVGLTVDLGDPFSLDSLVWNGKNKRV